LDKKTQIKKASDERTSKSILLGNVLENEKICLSLPKLQLEPEKFCFDLPKPKGCNCPPPDVRCKCANKNVTTRAIIPKTEICNAIGGPLTIEEIVIGEISIPNLQLKNFKGDFTYDSCKAKNVQLDITLSISTSFNGNIDLPDPLTSTDVDGSVTFNSDTQILPLGDLTFGSGSFSMQSSTTTIGTFSLKPDPIRGTTIDEVTAENIQMKCTSIPLDSPKTKKIGLCLPILNPMGPNNVITNQTTIAQMNSTGIHSPQASMNSIKASNVIIPKVTTQAFVAQSTTPTPITISKNMDNTTTTGDADRVNWMDFTLTLNISKMILRVKGGLEFTNLKGNVTTDSAISKNIDLDLSLKGIKIIGLNLCGMKIPEMEVEI